MKQKLEIDIRQRYTRILERIKLAAQSVGRNPNDIRLVVVTKGQPLAVVESVIAAGARVFAENYPEVAVPRIQALSDHSDLEWHMIGHVQSRKARLVSEHFDLLHSLDSIKLARRLNRFSGEQGRTLPVLLQVNVSGESSKFGWPAWEKEQWQERRIDVSEILEFSHLEIRGLMTIAPFVAKPEKARPYFQRLRQLQVFLSTHFPQKNWNELSMGMSPDFEVAIQEGATMVRVGEAVLGPRPQ